MTNEVEAMDHFLEKQDLKHLEIKKALLKNKNTNPAKQISAYSNDNQADLIIIGARGHTLLESLFMGSVTEKLLFHNTSIPTLVIR